MSIFSIKTYQLTPEEIAEINLKYPTRPEKKPFPTWSNTSKKIKDGGDRGRQTRWGTKPQEPPDLEYTTEKVNPDLI
jgi:hypothetical protein